MSRLLITALALFTLGCGTSDKPASVKQKTPANATQVEMQRAAKTLVSGFMRDLKSELMGAMKKGGPAEAIGACQIKAPQIAGDFSDRQWSIRRVTEKPRNPLNRANPHEQEILRSFADTLRQVRFFDEFDDPINKTGYTYYQPIKMGRFCLKCHGASKSLDEKVALALQDKYPDDKALDYSAGDLRGMFVVTIENKDAVGQLQRALSDSL